MDHNDPDLERIVEHLRSEIEPGDYRVYTSKRLAREINGVTGNQVGHWLGRIVGSHRYSDGMSLDGLSIEKYNPGSSHLRWKVVREDSQAASTREVTA
ncbi:hypothetical protein ACH9L7_20215 (plasmid) [Haloferax sp. S1W]|uniref:hypothetical protein n=1 Tax=Haloferax sp. S1W TaxID=3377110 RepID=UPI0037C5E011